MRDYYHRGFDAFFEQTGVYYERWRKKVDGKWVSYVYSENWNNDESDVTCSDYRPNRHSNPSRQRVKQHNGRSQ